jgi:hypothetical protein
MLKKIVYSPKKQSGNRLYTFPYGKKIPQQVHCLSLYPSTTDGYAITSFFTTQDMALHCSMRHAGDSL